MTIEIVKDAVDVGVSTNRLDEHRQFWSEVVGLRFDHLLKVGGGIHQHRYDLHGAVLKCNSHRDRLPEDAPTGLVALTTLADVAEEQKVHTPEGVPVTLVPELGDGVRTVVSLAATDPDRTRTALAGIGATPHPDGGRIGETVIEVVADPDRPRTHQRDGVGIRYLTVQVRDVETAHAHALRRGLTEGLAPVQLGDVAYISFVRLPDGDWVELSQRASLTGPLPGPG